MGSVVNIKQLSRFKMNRIILIFAFFGSAVLCEEVARKPKLFLSARAPSPPPCRLRPCHVTSITVTTCTGRKRRTISLDGMEPEGAVQSSTFKREVEGESVKQDKVSSKVNGNREGRFLLHHHHHHHLHLHLHLLHNHLFGFKRTLHTGQCKRMWINLNLKI